MTFRRSLALFVTVRKLEASLGNNFGFGDRVDWTFSLAAPPSNQRRLRIVNNRMLKAVSHSLGHRSIQCKMAESGKKDIVIIGLPLLILPIPLLIRDRRWDYRMYNRVFPYKTSFI